jgi:thiamine pyrophosphokinase
VSEKRAVLFANGQIASISWAQSILIPDDFLIAADGGLGHCLNLGLTPSLLIGDLDSADPQQVSTVQSLGCRVEKAPVEKDETDLELALLWAARAGYSVIRILGAIGGRIDQELANLSLLLLPELSGRDVRILTEEAECFLIRSRVTLHGRAGDRVSLLPWGGAAEGISTTAMAYPLHFERLAPERSRGISNRMLEETAEVSVAHGALLCIHSFTGEQ